MLAQLTERREEIIEVCRRFGVKSLAVFGSATSESFDPSRSDIDFLVSFDTARQARRFEDYFGLKEALEALVRRPVDLVTPEALANPYFAAALEKNCEEIYVA